MSASPVDTGFDGSIPRLYEQYMVPLMFEPYAIDLAARIAAHQPSRVLEIAAGTGVLTRELARALPADASIVATDLNQPMLDHAAAIGTRRPVEWRQADVMQLPFPDQAFDLVACQFGAMFFPDKARAYAEVRRVLKPDGWFVFNVWDRLDQNEFAATVVEALRPVFPEDPPQFLARVPHGYHEARDILQDLARGGFEHAVEFTTLPARSRAPSPRIPAVAICHGTPMRTEIESHGAAALAAATDVAESALATRFGPGPVDGKIQAHVISARR